MAKRGKMPFIAGKQYGDPAEPDADDRGGRGKGRKQFDPAEPDSDDMAGGPAATIPQLAPPAFPPKSLASRKTTEVKDKGPPARAPRGRGY